FLPGAGNATPLTSFSAGPFSITLSSRSIVAILIIVAMAMIHARGLGPGRIFQNSVTVLKICGLVVFVVLGFGAAGAAGPGQPALSAAASGPASGARMWLLALVPVMFSYSGWNAAVYVAEEVRSPARNLPLALGAGTATVVALYLALNILYLRV